MIKTVLIRNISALRTPCSKVVLKRFHAGKSPAEFDGEVATLYNRLSEQHRHEKGPWNLILQKVISLQLKSGILVDLASGPGEPAFTLASQLPFLSVISTDISSDMVDAASAKAASIHNMKALLVDVQDLSAFETNSVDVVTCCYGFMFPQDKHKALSETYRVLKPGGSLVATYWLNVDTIHIVLDMLRAVLNSDPPPLTIDPMSLSEPGSFDKLLKGAGFTNTVESVTSQYPFDLGTDEIFQYNICAMLIKEKLNELNAHEIAYQAFKDSISKYAIIDPVTGVTVLKNNVFAMASVVK